MDMAFKNIIRLAALVFVITQLQSCGFYRPIDFSIKETTVKGKNYDNDIKKLQDKDKELALRLDALESSLSNNISDMASISSQMADLSLSIANLGDSIDEEQNAIEIDSERITALQDEQDNQNATLGILQEQLDALQNQANESTAFIVTLSTSDGIVSITDPCGDFAGGYDEVLLKTYSGKYVAYFESGSTRYLSVLVPGVFYQTTDSQQCHFHIDNSGNVVY